jgi:hypothetical protein
MTERKAEPMFTLESVMRDAALRREGEQLLGARNFFLLESYGQFMNGPYSGRYVSATPMTAHLGLARRLVAGETLDIHLMHRHVSGNYESSMLCWREGRLFMVFEDREELA